MNSIQEDKVKLPDSVKMAVTIILISIVFAFVGGLVFYLLFRHTMEPYYASSILGAIIGNLAGQTIGFGTVRVVYNIEGSDFFYVIGWFTGIALVLLMYFIYTRLFNPDISSLISLLIISPFIPIITGVAGYRLKIILKK